MHHLPLSKLHESNYSCETLREYGIDAKVASQMI